MDYTTLSILRTYAMINHKIFISHSFLSQIILVVSIQICNVITQRLFACNSTSNTDIHSNIDIWHCHLGHIPNSYYLSCIRLFQLLHFTHLHCSICPLAKQHNLPFPKVKQSHLISLISFISTSRDHIQSLP